MICPNCGKDLAIFDVFGRSNKKAASLTTRNGLYFGEPCRDRTDNLLIKSSLFFVIYLYYQIVPRH